MASATWTVYLLRCGDGSLYAGIARDLAARLAAHNAGRGAKYTRSRLPVALAWSRGRQQPTDARRIEPALKRLTRAEKLRLVAGDEALWRRVRRAALGGGERFERAPASAGSRARRRSCAVRSERWIGLATDRGL